MNPWKRLAAQLRFPESSAPPQVLFQVINKTRDSVLELPAGIVRQTGTRRGDLLEISSATPGPEE